MYSTYGTTESLEMCAPRGAFASMCIAKLRLGNITHVPSSARRRPASGARTAPQQPRPPVPPRAGPAPRPKRPKASKEDPLAAAPAPTKPSGRRGRCAAARELGGFHDDDAGPPRRATHGGVALPGESAVFCRERLRHEAHAYAAAGRLPQASTAAGAPAPRAGRSGRGAGRGAVAAALGDDDGSASRHRKVPTRGRRRPSARTGASARSRSLKKGRRPPTTPPRRPRCPCACAASNASTARGSSSQNPRRASGEIII